MESPEAHREFDNKSLHVYRVKERYLLRLLTFQDCSFYSVAKGGFGENYSTALTAPPCLSLRFPSSMGGGRGRGREGEGMGEGGGRGGGEVGVE